MKKLFTYCFLLLFSLGAYAQQPDTVSNQSQLNPEFFAAPNYLQGVGAGNHGWSRDWWQNVLRLDSLITALDLAGVPTLQQVATQGATYTGAVTLGGLLVPEIRATTSAGISLRASNGGVIGLLGGGGVPGFTLSTNLDLQNTYTLINLPAPTSANQAATKAYVDANSGAASQTVIIISGGRHTITSAHEEVLFISENLTGEDSLFLEAGLALDSLSAVYIENHRGGTLVIMGESNNLNEQTDQVLTIPTRGGAFIRSLGVVDGVRRYSLIGNYE